MSDGDWFAPKRFGYGAGLPIAWQGWALMLGYITLVVVLATTIATRHPLLFGGLLVIATAALLVVSAQHTRGGWRWRWGD